MFDATRVVLAGIIDDVAHTTFAQRGDAEGAWRNMQSFEFVFILHLIEKVMGKTEILSQALQRKSQDILNAMELVSATKITLNNYRNDGWDSLIKEVTLFCNKHQIEVPDMKAPFTSTRYRACKNDLQFTFEHYYRVDLFTSTLDKQIHELNSRFNERTIELLSLSSSLVSKVINIDQICLLVEKFYHEDFTDKEITGLRRQLELFNVELSENIRLSSVSTLSDLCKTLVKTNKREEYALVDRVVRLILTLPVSTATTERGFSAMKIFKNRLRNKMADEYLTDSLVIYIEKEIADKFDSEDIIDEFKNLKGRRAEL
ncbi:uncharacterized protein LOC110931695 [Helianthus annuus]|uniref:uncharacterized protein LOC110931695 n=1 Tax=Helianthus annuus TaxID=4232 RepID=UPI000B8FCCB4|nr:uncharacterized protein LOC110931695 [Helianthus annuus]